MKDFMQLKACSKHADDLFLSKSSEKARCTKCKLDATRVVAKLGPVLIQVDQVLRDKLIADVPTVLSTKLKDLAKTMRDYNEEAKKKLADEAAPYGGWRRGPLSRLRPALGGSADSLRR